MARPSVSYEPRDPAGSVLHRIVQDHLETFLEQAARLRDGDGVPPFVERAFRDFLRCGFLAGGFARFRCGDCGLDRLVAFSCKGRALCPSCGGRRMAERAAHLVDHVIPDVPVRQWVLTLPHRWRYRLAWDHDLCRRVTAGFLSAVFRLLRDHARAAGLEQPRGGAVAIIQRFGGALNLNVHIHALVLDGVCPRDPAGAIRFHPARRLTTLDVAEVLAAVEPRIQRLLDGGELPEDGGHAEAGGVDRWSEEAPALAGLAAASVQGLVALGRQAGTRVRRFGHPRAPVDRPVGPCHARWNGVDLHAGPLIPGGQRDRLERVCRYVLRPPVASERLALTADGQVRLALRHPWADGTTHVVFDPVEFLGRLAVLVPRPRVNLILYYGVLGARAAGRREVVPRLRPGQNPTGDPVDATRATATRATAHAGARGQCWAALMKRTFPPSPFGLRRGLAVALRSPTSPSTNRPPKRRLLAVDVAECARSGAKAPSPA
ncbi:MAG TPA: transposase [Vicinamibacterales bacterium]|nr:transposase [Vicinamibacterales bacterium]